MRRPPLAGGLNRGDMTVHDGTTKELRGVRRRDAGVKLIADLILVRANVGRAQMHHDRTSGIDRGGRGRDTDRRSCEHHGKSERSHEAFF